MMVQDPEKADLDVKDPLPQDLDGPLEYPGVSTTKKNEIKKDEKHETDEDSIHSHSSNDTIDAVPKDDGPPKRTRSKSSSVRSRPLSIVPRSKRRGLFGQLALIPEVDNPYDYKRSTKWLVTLIVALAAAAAPMGSAIFLREFYHALRLAKLLTPPSCTSRVVKRF